MQLTITIDDAVGQALTDAGDPAQLIADLVNRQGTHVAELAVRATALAAVRAAQEALRTAKPEARAAAQTALAAAQADMRTKVDAARTARQAALQAARGVRTPPVKASPPVRVGG